MLFNSYAFILGFLPVTLILFFAIARFYSKKLAQVWLTLASLFFYGYWNFAYLPLLLVSISFNYYLGRTITTQKPREKTAKTLLWIGVSANLLLIGYYKYAGFFVESTNGLLDANLTIPSIILPLGISFYTFTQIAYLVDAYRGETKDYDFLTYALFISFFPQLIAGPLLLHSELIPQLKDTKKFTLSFDNLSMGFTWFCLGLAKKLLIADVVAEWVAPVFDNASQVSCLEAWSGALSYTLQLYFDFSGYSDMAIGLALMLNLQLPINFDSPYKATSIIDFWRRWHITLSRFLRDYLYIPLGGNRRGEARRYTNLFITMLLGGLWHGAGWTFVIWGGLHGIFLIINHGWRKLSTRLNLQIPTILGWLITFIAVVMSWVFFRAKTLQDAVALLGAMAGAKPILLPLGYQNLLSGLSSLGVQFTNEIHNMGNPKVVILLLFVVVFLPNTQQIMKHFQPNWWWTLGTSIVATLSLLSMNRISEFLYFQF